MHTRKLLQVAFFFILLCFGSISLGETNKVKSWIGLELVAPLDDCKKYYFDFFPQTRTNWTDGVYDETHTEVSFGDKVLPNLSFWFGYTSVAPGVVRKENDLWQQILWVMADNKCINFTSRTRVEERRTTSQPEWADTLRQKFIILLPNAINKNIMPLISEEIFINLNHPVWVNRQTINQNRAFIGFRVPLDKHVNFDIGYMNQYVLTNTVNQINHIIFLTLNIVA